MFRQKHSTRTAVFTIIVMSLFSLMFPTAVAAVTRTTGSSTVASKKILVLTTSSQWSRTSLCSLQPLFVASSSSRCCFASTANSRQQRRYDDSFNHAQSFSSSSQRYNFSYDNNNAFGGSRKPYNKLFVLQKGRHSQSKPLRVQYDEHDDNVSSTSKQQNIKFQRGDLLLVEVTRFGRLGASVDVVGYGTHDLENGMIDLDESVLGSGLILQSEIAYFRSSRQNLDVVLGEVLPAYVERVRYDDESKRQLLDVSLRPPGYAAKTEQLTTLILSKLQSSSDDNKVLSIGDKSTPEEINAIFPGISKGSFKKAISALYKEGKVLPGPYTVTLVDEKTTQKRPTTKNATNRKSSNTKPSSQRRRSNNTNKKQAR